LDADVYIIQECADPDKSKYKEYREFSKGCRFWTGDKKGVGIFAKNGRTLTNNAWDSKGLKYYISCNLDNKLNILGIWINNKGKQKYADCLLKYLTNHDLELDCTYIIVGDLNLDKNRGQSEKTQEIYKFLEERKFVSVYHYAFPYESYGKEHQKTFYQSPRGKTNPYTGNNPVSHVDYIFTRKERIECFKIEAKEKWIYKNYVCKDGEWVKDSEDEDDGRSDHIPLVAHLKYFEQKNNSE